MTKGMNLTDVSENNRINIRQLLNHNNPGNIYTNIPLFLDVTSCAYKVSDYGEYLSPSYDDPLHFKQVGGYAL